MKEINEYVEEMQRKLNDTINKLIIDDVFDISMGIYPSYNYYVECKRNIIDMVRNHNNKLFNPHKEEYRYTYYIEPVILSEQDFAYIVSKNNKQ